MATNIDKRRRIRALEATRDKLLIQMAKTKDSLSVVRTQLKAERKK